jgi:iron complex outermembrane receptor protein
MFCISTGLLLAASAVTNELPEIEVVASPVVQSESVSGDGVETVSLSRRQISLLNAQDLQTALRQVPGVSISRYSAIGSYGGAQGGSVYIRGVGTARPGGEVRMYSDGAPRESGVWGHPLMDSLPIDFADSVTVQKNPHPGERAGTFGAVETGTLRRREQGYEGEANLAYGRHSTMISSVSAGGKEEGVDAYAGMSYKTSDGHRDHNRAMLKSAFARAGFDLSAHDRLSFIYQRTESKVEDPGAEGGPVPVHDRFDLDSDLYNIRFDTERERLKGFSLVYFEHGLIEWHKDHLTDGVPASPAGDADTTWLNWGTRSRYEWNAWEGLWLVGAVDAASEGGHSRNTVYATGKVPFAYHGRFATVSPYLGAKYDFELGDEWCLTPAAGVRRHFHEVYDGEWAPAASLKLCRENSLEFFANASRAVHYPGIYTRAVSDDFAKGALDAETMEYFSVGAKMMVDEKLDALLCVFRSEVDDRIDKTATGYINSGSMRANGAEVSSHWYPHEDLTFYGGAAFAEPETSPVSRLPRWTFTLAGTWKICRYLKWSLDGEYIGSMNAYSVRADADRANLQKVGDAFVFNTRLAVPLESFTPVDGELYAAIENFTGTSYEYYPGYPVGGAMWYVGCRLRF